MKFRAKPDCIPASSIYLWSGCSLLRQQVGLRHGRLQAIPQARLPAKEEQAADLRVERYTTCTSPSTVRRGLSPHSYRNADWSITEPALMFKFNLFPKAVQRLFTSKGVWRLFFGTAVVLAFRYAGESDLLEAWIGLFNFALHVYAQVLRFVHKSSRSTGMSSGASRCHC